MHKEISRRRDELARLCERFGVARLEVFGSAARGSDFDPARSDIDFLVRFRADAPATLERFFDLEAALGDLFGRKVDLVEAGAVRNPYVRAGIERSREPVYGA